MSWLWPGSLLLLGLIPLTIAGYLWMLRRRKRFTVRYSSLALVREALPRQSHFRRHLPFALFLLALASLVIALGRPVYILSVPAGKTAIILTIDVSRSMRQTDIEPSRLKAAIAAARSFIQRQKSNTQIGIVAFAGYAELLQPPTNDQETLQTVVESLTAGRGTAIGSGILEALDAIAEVDQSVAPSSRETDSTASPTPVPRGAYAPDIIVLLTDGVTTTGPKPLDAAKQAADRGVRVYTIGFGTEKGDQFLFGGNQQQGTDPQSSGQFRMGLDEDTLKEIAAMTGGKYFAASSADELQEVFQSLPTSLITRNEVMEISVAFTAAGALLAALATALSLIWHPLP